MNPDELSEILERAFNLPLAQRDEFLRQACQGDEHLLAQVLRLLSIYETDPELGLNDPFLEAWQEPAYPELAEGQPIHNYVLKRKCGFGGMGEVWEAEQLEPFRRRVALKVVQRTNAWLVQAFHAERKTLARLEHPYIARIYGGDALEDGRPYMVMEFVEGEAIDTYCRRNKLNTAERLGLFRKVCDAVHYAHQHGVIHCDLKPNNILIARDGSPRLVDFGIAKLSAEAARTSATDPLTLAYASPEQIQPGADLTTATDVYSLGVVLYELLTGKHPYGPLPGNTAALLKRIRDGNPLPQAAVGAGHLGREMASIFLQAMSKEAAGRFESAAHLSEELGHRLENRPIDAYLRTCRFPFLYRSRKFVLRHALGLLMASMIFGAAAGLGYAHLRRIQEKELRVVMTWQAMALQAIRGAGDERSALLARQAWLLHARTPGQPTSLIEEALQKAVLVDHFARSLRHHASVFSVAFSPDGQRLASVSADRTVRIWDLRKPGAEPAVLRGHEKEISSVAFSPDGQRLASVSADRTVRIWDLRKPGAEPAVLRGHEEEISSVAFSPDGQRLASGSEDETVRIWDLRQPGAAPIVLRGHVGKISSVAFSPDGQRLTSGSEDETVRIWDLRQPGAAPIVLRGHVGKISSVAFSPDGQRLASGSEDGTIRLWGAEPLYTAPSPSYPPDQFGRDSYAHTVRPWGAEPIVLEGGGGAISSVAFSPDGQRLASGGANVQIWDLERSDGSPERRVELLRGHEGKISSVAFSADGQSLASGSWDRTVRIWDLRQPVAESAMLRNGSARLADEVCKLVWRNFTKDEWRAFVGEGIKYERTCKQLPEGQ